jgi:23S rRNA pseudouridine2605 synthase
MDGGLELVTSDGALAARLQRAVRSLPCEFSVRVHGEFGPEVLERILAGELDRGSRLQVLRCEPAGGAASNRWYEVETLGASGRDVRQLFERQGALVSRVLRTRLGAVRLGRQLARGQFRRLDPAEVRSLFEVTPTPAPASAPTPSAAATAQVTAPGSRRSRPSPRGRSGRAE